MKAYVITTGALFGLLTVAHIWRMVVEKHMMAEPWYIAITVASALVCVWACVLVGRPRRP